MAEIELAVIGAGPAGLAAALAAAEAGARVTLLDEYPTAGGQILVRSAPSSFPLTPTEARGQALLRQLAETPVELRLNTLVWSLSCSPEGHTLALHGPDGSATLRASAVILAAGARERVVPFPGWTLPGVMTVGGAGRLLKSYGVLPGRRVLLAGSGPLLLPVARELVEAGAQVVAVLEATRPWEWIRHVAAIWGQGERLREGWGYLRVLRRAGVPYRFGRTVVRALGKDEVEAAVVAALDAHGRPIPGSEETLAVDTICQGFGLLPNAELARLAGCELRFDPARGGWVPRTDSWLQTSVPGLFVAGEVAGIGGAEAAMLEGRMAGLAAACRLGHLMEADIEEEMASLQHHRRRHLRFGVMLNTLFVPKPGMQALTSDETIICRCEEVTAGEIRAAIAAGARELTAVKAWCRAGQGYCQGRTCGPLIAHMIAYETGQTVSEIEGFTARPPLKPLPLAALNARNTQHATRNTQYAVSTAQPSRRRASSSTTGVADVVVIGGGIVGAACAYYLCEAGLQVHLVERRFPAAGTSSACDGLILVWDKQPGPELALGQASAALWEGLAASLDFDFEYARKGTVLLAEGEQGLTEAWETARKMAEAGVRSELLDNRDLLKLEPNLAPDLAGGVFFPDDAQVDPRRATLALLEAAKRRGLVLHTGAEVTAIERADDGRVRGVVTTTGRIATGHVVNAAGVWSGEIARMVGATLPVRPRKGHIIVTEKVPGLVRHPLLEGGYVTTVQATGEDLQVALVAEPTASGTLLLGSSRQFVGFDRTVALEVIAAIAARAARFLPKLVGVQAIRTYAGLRPWSPDHLPLIGPVPGMPGFYVATGHEGAGICLAPITGQLIAQWVMGQEPSPLARQVLPGRQRGS